MLQLSQCAITELLILLPLCSPVSRETLSHTRACTQKLPLSLSLRRFRLETYHSIKNNTIRFKLSRQYTVGRLWASQDKKFIKMLHTLKNPLYGKEFDYLPLGADENFTSGSSLKMIDPKLTNQIKGIKVLILFKAFLYWLFPIQFSGTILD